MSAKNRQYLYGIVTAVLPILILLRIVGPEDVGLWLGLAAAVLGLTSSGTAFLAVKSQRSEGILPD